MQKLIYKVLRPTEWAHAQATRVYSGSADDRRDGFIHFSTAAQLAGTIERHFADATELVVLEVEAARFGQALKWEASRDGALFPHLYAQLPLSAVVRAIPPSEV